MSMRNVSRFVNSTDLLYHHAKFIGVGVHIPLRETKMRMFFVCFLKVCRVYSTPWSRGNLLELFFPPGNSGNVLEIYKVSWKFSALVCEFAYLSLILVTILVFQSVSVQNISR